MSELPLHVDNAPTAYRTSIGSLHVFVVTPTMDTMAAAHEDYGLWRSEHIFTTDGAIAVSGAFDATMCIPY